VSAAYDIHAAGSDNDPIIADHFARMWHDSPVPPSALVDDWFERTIAFIANARAGGTFLGYLARASSNVIGSIAVQKFAGLYPDVIRPDYRLYAYVWGVYVSPERRREGIASALVARSLEDLRQQGYSRVLLHASPMGRPVYEAMGFVGTNELQFDLTG